MSMQSKEKDNLLFARLFPGENVLECLEEVCRKHCLQTAVVLSGIGQLGSFELGFFREKGDYAEEEFWEPYELLVLTGNISKQEGPPSPACGGLRRASDYEFHLHAVLGSENKKVVGGHFIKGRVSITGEIVLLKTDLQVNREIEKETGLKGLFLD